MIKAFIFIRKKPELSMEEFVAYYETHHQKLATRTFPVYSTYVRRYLAAPVFEQPDDLGHHVVTEISFENEEKLARFREIAADPEVLATIRADEANFLVTEATRMFFVEEHGA